MEKPKMAPYVSQMLIPLIAAPLAIYVALMSAPASAKENGGDKDFGCTVVQNIETQTVNRDPAYENKLIEGGSGVRSVAAVRRYMTDKTRPLLSSNLSSAVGQQGGASSVGSGQ